MISQECIDFLKKTGCDKKSHSTDLMGEDYTLLDHLIATSEILEKMCCTTYSRCWIVSFHLWDCIFMSGGGMVSFDERDKIKDLIGERAEEIVYTFCMLDAPRYENIANMEDGELKDDLLFLNTYHDELYIPKEMSWERALQFIGEKNANICLYDRCDGCGHCVDICPSDIMHIDPVTRRAVNIEPNFCWECYSCVKGLSTERN